MRLTLITTILIVIISLLITGGWFVIQMKNETNTLPLEIFEPESVDNADQYPFPLTISIDGIKLTVDVVETAEEKAKGLSGRTNLEEEKGMLFIYEEPGLYSFWMKDMNFSIDIIWIDENLNVVDITENFKPESFPAIATPQKSTLYVVEVNAGWAQEHRIHIGSPVMLNGISGTVNESEILQDENSSQQTLRFNGVLLDVPFTPQAPFGDWNDVRQSNACEEASALMIMRWVKGRDLPLTEAKKEIIAISDYELQTYGHFHDSSAQDTIERIFKGYFAYDNISIKYDIYGKDIRRELDEGNPVIVPVNGQKLGNPYYTSPGPKIHMLVVRGYDKTTEEFITNDPGTKRGEEYRYGYRVLENALQNYNSGYQEPITKIQTAMIIINPR